MPWCANCKTEYVAGTEVCADCGASLVEQLPAQDAGPHGDPVLVCDAPDQETAEIVCASLVAAGIPAWMDHTHVGPAAGMMPYLGLAWRRGVYVAKTDAEAASALLSAEEPTEEELDQEEESDPTTLEEAEARVRGAKG